MTLQGRRLPDTPLTQFPLDYDDLQPGDYWLCQTVDGSRLLNVSSYPEDRHHWSNAEDSRYAGNLTGLVLGLIDPAGRYGLLSIHTVRLNEDGTVTVRPGDGSSNSILIKHREPDPDAWHGWIYNGVFDEVARPQ